MTVVLPAVFGVPASSAPGSIRATPTEPGASFADFLDGSSLPEQRKEKVFSFAELGMFGQYGAQPSNAATDKQKAGVLSTQTVSDLPSFGLSAASRSIQARLSEEDSENGMPGLAAGDITGTSRAVSSASHEISGGAVFLGQASQSLATDEAPQVSVDFGGDPLSENDDATFRSKFSALQENGENPVNLTVSGSSDALVIVVRSAGEADSGIHQLMKDTAAEFGMDVASFQMNGFVSQRSGSTSLGGKNGDRAR